MAPAESRPRQPTSVSGPSRLSPNPSDLPADLGHDDSAAADSGAIPAIAGPKDFAAYAAVAESRA
jgi:hypothetical protein